MSDQKGVRLSKLAKELNVGISTIVDFLKKKGHHIEADPNAKISFEIAAILNKEYSNEVSVKKESEKLNFGGIRDKKETITIQDAEKRHVAEDEDNDDEDQMQNARMRVSLKEEPKEKIEVKVVGKIDLSPAKPVKQVKVEEPIIKKEQEHKPQHIEKPVEKPVVKEPVVEKVKEQPIPHKEPEKKSA